MAAHQEDPHLNSATILALNRISALEQRIARLERTQRAEDLRTLALGIAAGALGAILATALLSHARR